MQLNSSLYSFGDTRSSLFTSYYPTACTQERTTLPYSLLAQSDVAHKIWQFGCRRWLQSGHGHNSILHKMALGRYVSCLVLVALSRIKADWTDLDCPSKPFCSGSTTCMHHLSVAAAQHVCIIFLGSLDVLPHVLSHAILEQCRCPASGSIVCGAYPVRMCSN